MDTAVPAKALSSPIRSWLDDSLDVTVPLQMQDTATVETYYKDNCALFLSLIHI